MNRGDCEMKLELERSAGIEATRHDELHRLLARLIGAGESEVCEFKRAGDAFGTDDIGRYFSALANEANLRGADSAWLVFGVSDNGIIVGTDYRREKERLHSLTMQIAGNAAPPVTFREIHELSAPFRITRLADASS